MYPCYVDTDTPEVTHFLMSLQQYVIIIMLHRMPKAQACTPVIRCLPT